jgi:hypothetical protein
MKLARFLDTINEAKSAPLYHGTIVPLIGNIIDSNELAGSEGLRGSSYGARTSRSYRLVNEFTNHNSPGGAVLVLDQLKLAQNRKIEPHAEATSTGSDNLKEFEEIVHGDIKPLDPYLISINLSPKDAMKFANDPEWLEWAETEYGSDPEKLRQQILALLKHPKLNKFIPRGQGLPPWSWDL